MPSRGLGPVQLMILVKLYDLYRGADDPFEAPMGLIADMGVLSEERRE